jgi:hypothetical protein
MCSVAGCPVAPPALGVEDGVDFQKPRKPLNPENLRPPLRSMQIEHAAPDLQEKTQPPKRLGPHTKGSNASLGVRCACCGVVA